MKMKKFKKYALVAVAAAGFVLGGCTTTLQDLENVDATAPDTYEVFQSPNEFPNLARICVDGVAFASSTREYQQITHIPEWDNKCPKS